MKNYSLLFLFMMSVFISCQNGASKKAMKTDKSSMTNPLWVSYKGKKKKKKKKIVLVSGDEEYRSEEALPQLAKILSEHHGFDCTVLFAQNPERLGLIDPNYQKNIPGLEQLTDADLMIIFTRFRNLPEEQMQHIDNYLKSGRPVVALRTATHAFNIKDANHKWKHYTFNYKGDKKEWQMGFGKFVLGETWYTHHGHHKHQSTRGLIAAGAENHPITNGIEDGAIWGSTDVYGIRMPMKGDAQSIIMGQTIDRAGEYDANDLTYGMRDTDSKVATANNKNTYNPNDPMPPIAWTKSYQLPNGKKGKSFTSTIGSSSDMLDEDVRRLIVNATYYVMGINVPKKAKVDLVGNYKPSPYSFKKDNHWLEKNLQVKDYVE